MPFHDDEVRMLVFSHQDQIGEGRSLSRGLGERQEAGTRNPEYVHARPYTYRRFLGQPRSSRQLHPVTIVNVPYLREFHFGDHGAKPAYVVGESFEHRLIPAPSTELAKQAAPVGVLSNIGGIGVVYEGSVPSVSEEQLQDGVTKAHGLDLRLQEECHHLVLIHGLDDPHRGNLPCFSLWPVLCFRTYLLPGALVFVRVRSENLFLLPIS